VHLPGQAGFFHGYLFFVSYGSEIHFIETHKRQRKPRSAKYRDAWELILQPFVSKENYLELPV
jgi:hypothetical protein